MFEGGSHRHLFLGSLESAGGALVDAGTAVDALGSIDHSDVVAGDSTLGADVDAGSAADTLGLFDCYHLDNLETRHSTTL